MMQATYCALCEHGYAEVTMQDIADRTDASKSSLHYHYDTKHDLLLAFLDHLYDEFADRFGGGETDEAGEIGETDADPLDRLAGVVDEALDEDDAEDRRDFRTAMLEIKAQAPYDEEFRERLAEFDRHVQESIRGIVSDGVESGIFRDDADPEEVAEFFATVFDGAHTRAISTDEPLSGARRSLAEFVERDLLADGVDREVDFE